MWYNISVCLFGGDDVRTEILGIGFDNVTKQEAVDRACELIKLPGMPCYVVTPNPEIVWMARKDEKLASALNGADLVLADGIGVTYGAKVLGTPLKDRVPGIDFISALFEEMAKWGGTVFLLGAKPGVAEKAAENIMADYPGINVCGCCDGYFTDDEQVISRINAAAPELLLVCLGAPKQEKWMNDNRDMLQVKLMAGLGGSLDVFAGMTERAPEKWREAGLEWLYRIIKEPKRIKRAMRLPLFMLAVIWERLFSSRR